MDIWGAESASPPRLRVGDAPRCGLAPAKTMGKARLGEAMLCCCPVDTRVRPEDTERLGEQADCEFTLGWAKPAGALPLDAIMPWLGGWYENGLCAALCAEDTSTA
jgi:hypothetical protein